MPIILVPQPSDDPNDPLNWPLWKRDMILVILSILSVIASTLSPLLAANTVTLSLLFNKDFAAMALATGYHLLGVGVAGFLFVASARVWGKRHLYLLGTVLIIASSAWGGSTAYNYKSLVWARVIQGVGLAPFEALVNASVGDLYFVHVRTKQAWTFVHTCIQADKCSGTRQAYGSFQPGALRWSLLHADPRGQDYAHDRLAMVVLPRCHLLRYHATFPLLLRPRNRFPTRRLFQYRYQRGGVSPAWHGSQKPYGKRRPQPLLQYRKATRYSL